jgi:hypothetical protein
MGVTGAAGGAGIRLDPDGNNIEAVWYDPARKEK